MDLKVNGNVAFKEDGHKYFDLRDPKKEYISVTTLIGKFEQQFDKDFWSKYKALEKILGTQKFSLEKPKLLKTKVWDPELLSIYDISENDFNSAQQDILDEWDKTNREACERGTRIHSIMENKFYSGAKSYSLKSYGIGGKFECKKDYTKLDLDKGVYPEYLVHICDDNVRLAGQIDLLIKDGNDITVGDYKSNGSIDKKSSYNTFSKKYSMMKYPLNNLMDCNFYHYSMQLSTYAWMLKYNNPEFNIKRLFLLHFPHDKKDPVIYEVEYLEDEVKRMINEYKKILKREERELKRKPIDF